MNQKWTKEEKEKYFLLFPTHTNKELQKIFPNKNLKTLRKYASRNNLKRNPETTKRMKSENMSGANNPRFGKIGINKGKIFSQEIRDKISNSRKEYYSKEENRNKLSGENNPMFGIEPYNKNKRMLDVFGEEKLKEIINKTNKTKKDNWDNKTNEEKERITQNRREIFIDRIMRMNKNSTIPELIVESILKEQLIEFKKQEKIDFYLVDYIIGNKIIEVQGDYWHWNINLEKYKNKNPPNIIQKNIRRDKAKLTFLKNKGYEVLYIWEYDLKNNIENCKNIIQKYIFN